MARLNFTYSDDPVTGYGVMGTELAKAFMAQGVDVMTGLHQTDTTPAQHALWASHAHNVRGYYEGQHRSILTMWESTKLPELAHEGLFNMDQVFVPSEQNVELYSRYHGNVVYVPLGVDPVRWRFRKRQPVERVFRFLADGRGPRKGTDVAVDAFRAAFPGAEDMSPRPVLMVKGSHHSKPQFGVELVSQRLSAESEVALYGAAHVYLAPTRGEGWGLCPLQAICQGIPTILTDAHGQAAFAHLGWGLHSKLVQAALFTFGEAGEWWEPDADQLVDYMRWMYENYDKASQMAMLFSDEALSQFTWENTSIDIIDRLELRRDEDFVPDNWVEPQFEVYPVVLRIPHSMSAAGTQYVFEAGKLYYERATIKRRLFDGGYLDPSCLEGDDTGLTPEQAERVGTVTASRGYCPMCLQELNSKPLSDFTESRRSHL